MIEILNNSMLFGCWVCFFTQSRERPNKMCLSFPSAIELFCQRASWLDGLFFRQVEELITTVGSSTCYVRKLRQLGIDFTESCTLSNCKKIMGVHVRWLVFSNKLKN